MTAARDLEQRAAEWLVRRDQPEWSREDQGALDAWIATDRAHQAAFWRLEHGWKRADRLAALTGATARRTPWPWVHLTRPALRHALAASLALALLLGGLYAFDPFAGAGRVRTDRLVTAIGARRNVTLSDGSRLVINTDSVLRTAVGRARRQVWLDRGEAYFEVAHDARHPFVIHAGDQQITVLGTRFSVRRDAAGVRVAVAEGRVRIENADQGTGSSAVATAGDVAVAHGASLIMNGGSTEAVQDALAWRDGMLAFNQTMLSDAVEEFNRYNTRHLRVVGDKAGRIRIGGTFEATNAPAFARLLHTAFGLEVREDGNEIIITS